jgi:hypothetical protein
MATQAFTPAQLASNIAFQTAKKAKPSVSTTPAPLQSLLNPKPQQSQAPSTNNIWWIPWMGLQQVNNPIQFTPQTPIKQPTTPKELPKTGADLWTLSENEINFARAAFSKGFSKDEVYAKIQSSRNKPSSAQEFAWWVAQSALETAKLWVMLAEAVAKVDPLLSTITKGVELAWGEQLVQGARQLIQKWKEKVMQKLDAGKRIAWGTESPYYKWWKLLGDIAQTVLLPWPWWVTKWAWLLKGAWQLAKQWAIETAKFTAISEKRLPTPKELAYWVGGNLVLWWWGKLLWTLASKTKWVSSKIAEWIVW